MRFLWIAVCCGCAVRCSLFFYDDDRRGKTEFVYGDCLLEMKCCMYMCVCRKRDEWKKMLMRLEEGMRLVMNE